MTLRKLRKTHSKILALQAGEEVRPQTPEPPDIRQITQRWDVPIPLEGGKELAKTRMNTVSRMMLEHAGFDGKGSISSQYWQGAETAFQGRARVPLMSFPMSLPILS